MSDIHSTGPFIAAIDQGTTSSRCIVFDKDGRIVSVEQKEHEQIFPKPGWVEHDANEIWANVQEVVAGAVEKAGITSADVKAIGITNQRETTLMWDKNTGEPVHNALVWQDTRTDALCRELGRNVGQDRFRRQTGLPLASYFAGPKVRWLLDNVEGLRKMEDPASAPSIRLSKGAHLVLKRTAPWKAALATPIDKYRITFALPWEDMLLLGTTDEEFEGDPADVRVTEADTAQILDEAAFSIRDQQLSRDLITYSFAGLRVLPGGPGDTSKAKRETVVTEGRGGMLSVAGGKWTTFRHIGRTVMKKLEQLPGHPLGNDFEPISELPGKMPLPGIANPRAVAHRLMVDGQASGASMASDTAKHLATHYGSLSFDIARLANEDAALAERIHPDAPEIWAQVAYARDHEWAETADDVLRRRTTLTIRGLATDEIRGKVDDLLAERN
ncbi:Glycerol kinase [Streptomyces xanthochromogenes]